jgi:hypothetical protein
VGSLTGGYGRFYLGAIYSIATEQEYLIYPI